MRYILVSLLAAFAAASAFGSTRVLFSADPHTSYSIGPFPSNSATVPDTRQLTGLRVDLPAEENNCQFTSTSVCGSLAALNQLDGFSVNPRLMVCFSGPVQASTLARGISLQPANGGEVSSVNQVVYDPSTNCAFAYPNSVLNQQTTYRLIITSAVTDVEGEPVQADPGFEGCLDGGNPYCAALEDVGRQAKLAKRSGDDELSDQETIGDDKCPVVAASLFTTMSATNWLEQVREMVDDFPLAFNLPAGFPNTFRLNSVQSINWMPSQSTLVGPQAIPVSALGGVDSIAFGLFLAPNYISTSGAAAGTIPQTPTALPPARPNAIEPVSYHVFLPASTGSEKIPVVIYGHGLSDNQFGAPTYIASTLARKGFATLAMEVFGHGYGAASYVKVTNTTGQTFFEKTPGRGVLLPPNTAIGATDGCLAPGAFAVRDCSRQTAVDLFALAATIRATNGLGLNLDPNRIYYVGQSFGSTYGTLFQATEPAVRTAVLNVGGGSSVDVARLAVTGLPLDLAYLQSSNPALFNTSPTDTSYFHPYFDDSYPFRDRITIAVAGAVPIQAAFAAADWLGMSGDPLAYATHLRTSARLAGVPPKATLFQFGYGDLEVPNPTESALVRAANGLGRTTFFHYDAAVALDPALLGVGLKEFGFPILPHRVLSNPTIVEPGNAAEAAVAYALQQQVGDFFFSNGTNVSDPNVYLSGPFSGAHLFDILRRNNELPVNLDFPVAP